MCVVPGSERAIIGWKNCQTLNLLATVNSIASVPNTLYNVFPCILISVGCLIQTLKWDCTLIVKYFLWLISKDVYRLTSVNTSRISWRKTLNWESLKKLLLRLCGFPLLLLSQSQSNKGRYVCALICVGLIKPFVEREAFYANVELSENHVIGCKSV